MSELPIGRRMAQLRARRRLSQQVLADLLGKSKSWVDKVERGVRTLDKLSTIQHVADVLHVELSDLLTTEVIRDDAVDGVEDVRGALALSPSVGVLSGGRRHLDAQGLAAEIGHAWATYRHARYEQLLRALPVLIADAQRIRTVEHLAQVYQLTTCALTKVGEAESAWLAADRAMAVANKSPTLLASAAICASQALRALNRSNWALSVVVMAARHAEQKAGKDAAGLVGALYLQAALASATCGNEASVREFLDLAAGVAGERGEDRDHVGVIFGPTTVELTRVVTAVDLGAAREALDLHVSLVKQTSWRLLPPEHRADYLLQVVKGCMNVGEHRLASRTLYEAFNTAPAEIRLRPFGRTLVATVARCAPGLIDVAKMTGPRG